MNNLFRINLCAEDDIDTDYRAYHDEWRQQLYLKRYVSRSNPALVFFNMSVSEKQYNEYLFEAIKRLPDDHHEVQLKELLGTLEQEILQHMIDVFNYQEMLEDADF